MNALRSISLDPYVVEVLLPDLVRHDHSPSAFLVYLVLDAAGDRAALSHAQLAERAGLSRRSVQTAVARLQRRRLIEITRRGPTEISEYRVLRPWRRD